MAPDSQPMRQARQDQNEKHTNFQKQTEDKDGSLLVLRVHPQVNYIHCHEEDSEVPLQPLSHRRTLGPHAPCSGVDTEN